MKKISINMLLLSFCSNFLLAMQPMHRSQTPPIERVSTRSGAQEIIIREYTPKNVITSHQRVPRIVRLSDARARQRIPAKL